MLILQRLSGFAVLLLTLHFVHVLHHFFVDAPHHSPVFWAGMVPSVVVLDTLPLTSDTRMPPLLLMENTPSVMLMDVDPMTVNPPPELLVAVTPRT